MMRSILSPCPRWNGQDTYHQPTAPNETYCRGVKWNSYSPAKWCHTAHIVLQILLDLSTTEKATCNIIGCSLKGKLICDYKLIILDEATMSYKSSFEALGTALQDLRHNIRLIGIETVLLGRDFRKPFQ